MGVPTKKTRAIEQRDLARGAKRRPAGWWRETCAHHEAGHAVIALRLGVPVRYATIKRQGPVTGHVTFGRFRMTRYRVALAIPIILAGPDAQRRFAPRSNWRQAESMSSPDDNINAALFLADWLCADNAKAAQKYLAYMATCAEQLVDLCWADIEAVAKALLQRQTLTGSQIKAAMQQARRKQRKMKNR